MHAKAFVVAGVTKAELLSDLRSAVDKSIAEGGTLAMFQKDFDKTITKHGWNYKGNRGWRTATILNTNTAMAYSAGSHKGQNDPAVKAARPYLRYLPSTSKRKRDEHKKFYNMVLHIDDPFWLTHRPPNGWGCHCGVTSASKREIARMVAEGENLRVLDKGPTLKTNEYVNKSTGQVRTVLEGCDPGFDYNPGVAGQAKGYANLTKYFETLPNDIARAWATEFVAGPAFEMFVDKKIKGNFPVAILRTEDMEMLDSKSQVVWLSDDSLAKNKGELPSRSVGHSDLELADYQMIPEIIETGEVYKQGDDRLVILKRGDRTYRAALKRTRDGKENYFLSLFTVGDRAIGQLEKNNYERVR